MGRKRTPLGRRACLKLWGALVGLVTMVTVGGRQGDDEHTVAVAGSSDGISTYEITVSDEIRRPTPTDGADAGIGQSVEGVVGEDIHEFRFSGDLTDVQLDGTDPTLFVDGQRVSTA
jgi:hypothetical protein